MFFLKVTIKRGLLDNAQSPQVTMAEVGTGLCVKLKLKSEPALQVCIQHQSNVKRKYVAQGYETLVIHLSRKREKNRNSSLNIIGLKFCNRFMTLF